MLCTVLSLGELAIMYPVNGAYYEYTARFIDPSWLVTIFLNKHTRRGLSSPFRDT